MDDLEKDLEELENRLKEVEENSRRICGYDF